MTMLRKIESTLAAVLLAITASAAATWSDTPVTCHWIGAVKAGTIAGYDYAAWTNADNWAEGKVPGRFERDGATVGCEGCTAVFDRECDYSTVDFTGLYSVSNIVVSGTSVPKIRLGHTTTTAFYFERGGGFSVAADVVTAPELRPSFYYRRGAGNNTTTLYFENNSASPLVITTGFRGPDVAFSAWAGTITLAMRGTGEIKSTGYYSRSRYSLLIKLEMNGGKFTQSAAATTDQLKVVLNGVQQHFEISSGTTMNVSGESYPILADSDLLISGGGTCYFNAAADKTAVIGASSDKTLTLDCNIKRTAGGKFQIGSASYGGTIAIAAGRSFNAPVDIYNGTLKLADDMTFTNAISMPSGASGTISGGSEADAKITGGVAGTTRPLTLTGRLAIASDITATTTLAADAELSFRKAADAATSFTISSLKLTDDETIPVEDGVTATIAAIDNNGHALDIRPSGSGKVMFTGLSAGRAPEWLTLNGAHGKIAADGELLPPGGMLLIYR